MAKPKPLKTPARSRPDWVKAKYDYVHGTESLRQLAARIGVTETAAMKQSADGKWLDAKREFSAKVGATLASASEKAAQDRIAEFAAFTSTDLQLARAFKSLVAQKASTLVATPGAASGPELRALANAAETAQRIGRIALGIAPGATTLKVPMAPTGPDAPQPGTKGWLEHRLSAQFARALEEEDFTASARIAELLAKLQGHIVEKKLVRRIGGWADLEDEEVEVLARGGTIDDDGKVVP